MSILTSDEVSQALTAAAQAGLATSDRRIVLMADVLPEFLSTIPELKVPRDQLSLDVKRLNKVESLPDGSVPLLAWLKNAADAAFGLPAAKVFTALYAKAARRTPTSNPLVDEAPINGGGQEVEITRQGLLRFGFLEEGARMGRSVGKMLVPIYRAGQPEKTPSGQQAAGTGTGWLIAPSLIVTNLHVLRARRPTDNTITQGDFALQTAGTMVQFDFDDPNDPGEFIAAGDLLVSDETLDYAILRLKYAQNRAPLPIRLEKTTPKVVNLIQHPNGRSKQIGIRNNSIFQTKGSLLLYFTDTLEGSSGAPVFDDFWRVVALHRGYQEIENFVFQGNPTTVANYGTQIQAILQSVKTGHADAWSAIQAAQPGVDAVV